MSSIGRNALCPCGSGRKFKRCCLNKSEAGFQSYLPAERDSALAKLMRFCNRAEFNERHDVAFELFWGDWFEDEPDERLKEVMASDQADLAYHSWFAFDFDFGGEKNMLDLFLQREGGKISSAERNYLEGMRESHLRVYEVVEVKPEEGFTVRDLWDDRRLWVRERLGTRQIVQWDIIAGRIGVAGDGTTIFETLPYVFPATLKDELQAEFRQAYENFACEFPGAGIVNFFRFMAPVLHSMWLEEVALLPFPQILTAEGDPVIFARVVFELVDRARVESVLRGRPDIIDHGDGTYGWVEAVNELQRSLGTIVLEERRLVFETTSQRRAERAGFNCDPWLGTASCDSGAGSAPGKRLSHRRRQRCSHNGRKSSSGAEDAITKIDQRRTTGDRTGPRSPVVGQTGPAKSITKTAFAGWRLGCDISAVVVPHRVSGSLDRKRRAIAWHSVS